MTTNKTIEEFRSRIREANRFGVVLAAATVGLMPMSAKTAQNPGEARGDDSKLDVPTYAQAQEVDDVKYFLDGKEVASDDLGEKMLDSYAEKIVQQAIIPDLIELRLSVPKTTGDNVPSESVDVLDGTPFENMKGHKLGRELNEFKKGGILELADVMMDKYVEGDLSSKDFLRSYKSNYEDPENLSSLNMLEKMRPGFFFMTDESSNNAHNADNISYIVSELPENNVEMLAKIRGMKEGSVEQRYAINEYMSKVKCLKLSDKEKGLPPYSPHKNFMPRVSLNTIYYNLKERNRGGANLRIYCGSLQDWIKERLPKQGIDNVHKLLEFANNNQAKKYGVDIRFKAMYNGAEVHTGFAELGYLPLKTKENKPDKNVTIRQNYMAQNLPQNNGR